MIRLGGLISLPPIGRLKENAKDPNWIEKAVEKPGALHQQLKVPTDEKIPAKVLRAAAKSDSKLGKRARLAITLRNLRERVKLTEEEIAAINEVENLIYDNLEELIDSGMGTRKDITEASTSISPDGIDGEYEEPEVSPRAQLLAIHNQSTELYNSLSDTSELEEWVRERLAKATEYVNAIYQHYQYEKQNNPSLGTGVGSPSDRQAKGV